MGTPVWKEGIRGGVIITAMQVGDKIVRLEIDPHAIVRQLYPRAIKIPRGQARACGGGVNMAVAPVGSVHASEWAAAYIAPEAKR